MKRLQTPSTILNELRAIRTEAAKGSNALFDAEQELAQAELDYDTKFAMAIISATGNVEERKAAATIAAGEAKFARDIARAKVNRVKTKLKILSEQQMNVQTEARMLLEIEWKLAGIESET